jgi:hypothetical protein
MMIHCHGNQGMDITAPGFHGRNFRSSKILVVGDKDIGGVMVI